MTEYKGSQAQKTGKRGDGKTETNSGTKTSGIVSKTSQAGCGSVLT
jgi:hypothetical protein